MSRSRAHIKPKFTKDEAEWLLEILTPVTDSEHDYWRDPENLLKADVAGSAFKKLLLEVVEHDAR